MADILKELLIAYKDLIELETSNTLSYVRSVYIIQTPELLPPDWSCPLPCVLIYPSIVPVSPACLPGVVDNKTYIIGITIAMEGYGDETRGLLGSTNNVGLYDMVSDIETLFRRETFGLSDAAWTIQLDYTQRRYPPFMDKGIHQGHLSFSHTYFDMRG